MSKRNKKTPTGDYAVGYCKPPESTRFRPRRSGNPARAASKRPNEAPTVADMLAEKHAVIKRGKRRRITGKEVIVRKQMTKAMNGDLAAAKFLMEPPDQRQASHVATSQSEYDLSLLTDEEFAELERILCKAVRNGS